MGLLYFIITFVATTIGSIAGLGGGIIIKPCLDTIGTYDVRTIGILSSITVLSMAVVSTIKYAKSKMKIDLKKAGLLSLGASIGGVVGKIIFEYFSMHISDDLAKGIQAILLIILLLFVMQRKRVPILKISHHFITISSGIMMGAVSSFLGIGGGPVNVAIICIVLSVGVKDAAVYSIFTILFSQLTTVMTSAANPGFAQYDLHMLLYMIPSAILGALLGSTLNRKLTEDKVELLFNSVMILLLFLNAFNVYRFLLR